MTTTPKKIKKWQWWTIVIVGLMIVGGISSAFGLGKTSTPEAQTIPDTTSTVTVTPEAVVTTPPAAEPTVAPTPPPALTEDGAMDACDNYTTAQFRYGVKVHRFTGVLANRPTDTGRFVKVLADVTNQYGAKMKGVNVECTVDGTDAAPVMTAWDFY